MASQRTSKLIRLGHRYLGIIIGIQFLLWTISGVFFAWTNINEIRGDHLRQESNGIVVDSSLVSPASVLKGDKEIKSFQLVSVFGEPFYRVGTKEGKIKLFDARTGASRDRLTEKEAIRVASEVLKKKSDVVKAELLTSTDGHHEYREKQLPAWAIEFEEPSGLVVYVSADDGQVRSFRTTNWRIFDFLWMLHTMDFMTRDDINNWALRIFSALGILMIVSGYLYWLITYRKVKWRTKGQ